MKRVEIIDHKSEYDKLQQMDYDELYKLLKEYGNAIWDDDYGEKTVLNQDPPYNYSNDRRDLLLSRCRSTCCQFK